jgi:uncharacterized protein (TIGR03083 family)
MTETIEALRTSVGELRGLVEPMTPEDLDAQAYPTEWTVADVLSHLGSGTVIFGRWLDDGLSGRTTPDDFPQSVWDEWNAKPPQKKAADALAADAAFLRRIDNLSDEERAGFTFSMGPMTFDFDQFLGLRLNEHVLHSWDIAVARAPRATLLQPGVEVVVDRLELLARRTGQPTDGEQVLSIRTVEPRRDFQLSLGEAVSLAPVPASDPPDLELPAEAFIRLIYGRLDPDHTPPVTGTADLAELRQIFRGP